ncbi:hypothetical protein CWO84_09960 [Methylomonas sp. Kb3]|uniref:hypothetical protein n=1 Tax=Methylomonas sp. Kb3 TaxID=1611544 RepID=UPI000C32F2D4|nr:hypothetical protein [Methylomonas sp. Kb3]PKD40457.1 hypothetical protein CWO84_09960 [Methylomonas sp. Kb3]
MIDEQRPSGLFSDLATNPETKAAILIDCELAVDEFAAKHGKTSVNIMPSVDTTLTLKKAIKLLRVYGATFGRHES